MTKLPKARVVSSNATALEQLAAAWQRSGERFAQALATALSNAAAMGSPIVEASRAVERSKPLFSSYERQVAMRLANLLLTCDKDRHVQFIRSRPSPIQCGHLFDWHCQKCDSRGTDLISDLYIVRAENAPRAVIERLLLVHPTCP